MDSNSDGGLRRLADQFEDRLGDRLVVEEIGLRFLIVQKHRRPPAFFIFGRGRFSQGPLLVIRPAEALYLRSECRDKRDIRRHGSVSGPSLLLRSEAALDRRAPR
jgi:hypothetical protein